MCYRERLHGDPSRSNGEVRKAPFKAWIEILEINHLAREGGGSETIHEACSTTYRRRVSLQGGGGGLNRPFSSSLISSTNTQHTHRLSSVSPDVGVMFRLKKKKMKLSWVGGGRLPVHHGASVEGHEEDLAAASGTHRGEEDLQDEEALKNLM